MFWSDQTKGTIERAAMDGSRHRIIVADLVWPNEVALDRHMRFVLLFYSLHIPLFLFTTQEKNIIKL